MPLNALRAVAGLHRPGEIAHLLSDDDRFVVTGGWVRAVPAVANWWQAANDHYAANPQLHRDLWEHFARGGLGAAPPGVEIRTS